MLIESVIESKSMVIDVLRDAVHFHLRLDDLYLRVSA